MFAWRRARHAYAAVFDYLDDKWRLMSTPGPPPAADPPGTEPPIHLESGPLPSATSFVGSVPSLRGIVKQSLTKKSRMDLGQRMIEMCTLSGWQATTLNPDMGDADKLAILTGKFGKLAVEDHPADLYGELIGLSAVTMGWAQGIARREARERKRRSRASRKERKRKQREGRRQAAHHKRPVETIKTAKT